jgi:hypothetical protein
MLEPPNTLPLSQQLPLQLAANNLGARDKTTRNETTRNINFLIPTSFFFSE